MSQALSDELGDLIDELTEVKTKIDNDDMYNYVLDDYIGPLKFRIVELKAAVKAQAAMIRGTE